MAANFKIWDTYIAPATDGLMSIGSALLQFNELYIKSGFINSTGKLYFSDANTYINSWTTGHLDLTAATSIDINANMDISAKNIITDTITGTIIGTATSQKLGFYGVAPIVQPSNTTDIKDALVNLGLLASGGATSLNLDGGDLVADEITASSLTAESGVTQYSVVLADLNGKLVKDADIRFLTDTLYVGKLDISANPTTPKIYEQETEPDIPNNTFAFWYDTSSGVDETYLVLDRNGVQKKCLLT
jgi:hypothetical protein